MIEPFEIRPGKPVVWVAPLGTPAPDVDEPIVEHPEWKLLHAGELEDQRRKIKLLPETSSNAG